MGCIPWADGYMLRPFPKTRNDTRRPVGVVPQERRQCSDALCRVYITIAPKGTGLAVRCRIPASVASAPRGGVACNDAAARQEEPILGWVRDARVRSQERNENTVNDERM